MIDIGYTLTDPAVVQGWEQRHDVATADPGDLLWSGFPGSIRITTTEGELAPSFDWVPLLHFARSLILVVDELTDPGSSTRYGFTESDDRLRFERSRELVQVSASFNDTVLSTTMPELSDAVRRFAQRLLDDLTTRYPGLTRNPAAATLRTDLAQRA